MKIGKWSDKDCCPADDNNELEKVILKYMNKQYDRFSREDKQEIRKNLINVLANTVNSSAVVYVLGVSDDMKTNLDYHFRRICDANEPTSTSIWYCYTSEDRIEIESFKRRAFPIPLKELLIRAERENIRAIWFNPSWNESISIGKDKREEKVISYSLILSTAEEEIRKCYEELINTVQSEINDVQFFAPESGEKYTTLPLPCVLTLASAEKDLFIIKNNLKDYIALNSDDCKYIEQRTAEDIPFMEQ